MPRAGTTKQRGYGHKWRLLSEAMVKAHPWCSVCGRRDDLTLDHIVPKARGGTDAVSNLRVACRSCNSAKRDRRDVPPPPPQPRPRFSRQQLR